MARYCFELQVRRDRLDEYKARHRAVWPEMLAALRDTGWRNYSLFLRDDGLLIGYVEADDLRAAQAGMAATEVNARWQAEMAPFFVDLDGRPDEGFVLLEEVFHLEDQLGRRRRPRRPPAPSPARQQRVQQVGQASADAGPPVRVADRAGQRGVQRTAASGQEAGLGAQAAGHRRPPRGVPVELSGQRAQDVGGWERRTERVNRRIGTRARGSPPTCRTRDCRPSSTSSTPPASDAWWRPAQRWGNASRPVAASSRIGRRTTVLTAQIATGSRNSPAASGRSMPATTSRTTSSSSAVRITRCHHRGRCSCGIRIGGSADGTAGGSPMVAGPARKRHHGVRHQQRRQREESSGPPAST